MSTCLDIEVTNLSMLTEVALPKEPCPEHSRYRSNFIFRGLSSKEYNLQTSLNRVCGKHLDLEKALLRNFQKYASLETTLSDNFWEILALAQHHGLPTRLLDWSVSPLVAAHFATESFKDYGKDAAIWCLDCVKYIEQLPSELKAILEKENAYTFTTKMLGKYHSFEDLPKRVDGEPYPIIFEPPSIDQRIVSQYAYFSVMSDPTILISDWLSRHTDLYYRIIIPKEHKLRVRDQLENINISERTIYPGLDGLCKWLTRYYTPYDEIYH